MSGGVSTRLHAQYLPQGNEKLLLRDIICVKRRSCLPPPALYSDESHETNITVESPSEWTSTTPVVETSESIEPNDYPGSRGFLLFFIGKFCDANRFLYFF